jgi:hypothetical protein
MVSDSTLTGTDVQDGTLTGADVQDGSIAGVDVQDGSLTGSDIQDGSVTGTDVQDGSLGRADLGESLINRASAIATQSGTFKDFSGIPSWARRVTLLLYGVSTNGASDILVQLGSSATPLSSGYINTQSVFSWSSGILTSTSTAGIPIYNNSATYVWTGRVVMDLLEPGLHNWVVSATLTNTVTSPSSVISSGIAPLSSALTMVRLTTASGTPTFDAGFASISWE